MGDVTPASWLLVRRGHGVLAGLLGRDTTSGSLRCHLVDRRMVGDEPHGRHREWWPSQPGGQAAGGGGVVPRVGLPRLGRRSRACL